MLKDAIKRMLQRRHSAPASGDVEDPARAGTVDRQAVFLEDSDLKDKIREEKAKRVSPLNTLWNAYLSLGVIFGDIGTAPIYVFTITLTGTIADGTVYDADGFREDVLGIFGLIFYILTLIGLIKYVRVVLNACDRGEGGTIALYAHLCRTMGLSAFGTMRMQAHRQVLAMQSAASTNAAPSTGSGGGGSQRVRQADSGDNPRSAKAERLPWFRPYQPVFGCFVFEGQHIVTLFRRSMIAQRALLFVVMAAMGLVIGDAIIMPGITMISVISVLNDPSIGVDLSPITGIVASGLFVIFMLQRFGTRRLSVLFSPVILLWLLANCAIGIYNLHVYGADILHGFNPKWIFSLLSKYDGAMSWNILAGSVLCVAGAETISASVGNFTQKSVAWAFVLVYPCLVVAYLGQGAYAIANPYEDPFWSGIPDNLLWPMFTLASITAIVACQSVITGTFSLVRQAIVLGILPKLRIIHTDREVEGRIFIPVVNYSLMVVTICMAVGFLVSNAQSFDLGTAYGFSVMGVMLCTTLLLLLNALVNLNSSLLLVIPIFLFYATMETVLLISNILLVPYGAWVPLVISTFVFSICYVWWAGSYQCRKMLIQTSRRLNTTLIRTCLGATKSQHRPAHIPLLPSQSLNPESSAVSLSLGSVMDPAYHHSNASSPRLGARPPPTLTFEISAARPFPSDPVTDQTSPQLPNGPGVASTNGGSATVVASASGRTHSPVNFPADPSAHPATHQAFLALLARPDRPLAQVTGLGIYYGESPMGIPLVMKHFLKNVDAIHEVCIILIVRILPMPLVRSSERLLVRPVKDMPNFYQVVARYGYQDEVDHSDRFVSKLISTIMFKLELKAGLKYQGRQDDFVQELEEDEEERDGADSEAGGHSRATSVFDGPQVYGLDVIRESYLGEEVKAQEEMAKWEAEHTFSPFVSRYALECLSRIRIVAEAPGAPQAAIDALSAAQSLLNTASAQVVHYRARILTRPGKHQGRLQQLFNGTIGTLYRGLERFAFSDVQEWKIPPDTLVELGISVEI